MQIRRDEVRLLMEGREAFSPAWFIYNRYTDFRGRICPDIESEWREQYAPLQEPTLFTSFTELSAHGTPSRDSVLRWTHRYGLLRVNEVGIEEFRDASKEAHRARSLLEQIRGGDVAALRSRLSYSDRQVLLDGNDIGVLRYQEPNPERTRWKTVRRGDRQVQVRYFVEGVDSYIYPEADDEMILFYSVLGLEHIVTEKLGSVRRVFGIGDDEHPRPLAEWRPELVDYCPDLLSTLWYQFAVVVAERRPIKRCVMCNAPFVPRRSTKKVCGKACQKMKERHERKARGDTI